MKLDDLRPDAGSTKSRKRIGRGTGSGHGKTSTRGHKGDKARGSSKLGFEGGQTPFHRRLPRQRGLPGQGGHVGKRGIRRPEYAIINLGKLDGFEAGAVVSPETLVAARVVSDIKDGLRILGEGKITKALTVRAHHFSKSAEAAIVAAGGTAEKI